MTASLFLISVGVAATTRGSTLAWNLQFASFQLAPLVFLATVIAMGTGRVGALGKQHREFVYTLFGVLGFALFSSPFSRWHLRHAAGSGLLRLARDVRRDLGDSGGTPSRPVRT